jgi:hypothetical protein
MMVSPIGAEVFLISLSPSKGQEEKITISAEKVLLNKQFDQEILICFCLRNSTWNNIVTYMQSMSWNDNQTD